VIEREENIPLRRTIQSTLDKFSDRRDRIFSLHEQGYKNVEIAKMMGLSRFIIGREIKLAEQELRKQLKRGRYDEQFCE